MVQKISLFFIFLLLTVLPVFSSGEAESSAIPSSSSSSFGLPKLSCLLQNRNDFRLVLEAFDTHIQEMEPLVNSIASDGLEVNREAVDKLRDAVQWWQFYISIVEVDANSPDLERSDVDEFFSNLILRDEQFNSYLNRINQLIEQETRG